MHTKCFYRNCKNTSQNISMFRFPTHDQERLKLWIRNSGNIILDSLTKAELRCRYICAAHFHPNEVHKGNIRSRLVGLAIPIPHTHSSIREEISIDTSSNNSMELGLSSPQVLKVKTPKKVYTKVSTFTTDKKETPSSSAASPSFFQNLNLVITPTQSPSLQERPLRNLPKKRLFEGTIDDTPKTKRLKTKVVTLQRKNKAQKSKICRLQVKSKTKKKAVINNYPSEPSKTLALMQLRRPDTKKKWTKAEKDFCLSLYYKSPATYYFLRRQGVVLAAPTSIKRWLSKSDCLPGLSTNINQIKKRFQESDIKEQTCVICFDEMSIMTNLEYNKKYDLIEGFEDLGAGHRSNKFAKYALVFVVRGLYTSWKLPVAYFLSGSNVKADTLGLLLKAVINKLFGSNLLPKAVVCDQATTNQKLFRSLGVSSDFPFFFCNNRKIFAIFDVPHILKNIRNNLLTNDFLNGDKIISFKDIIKTYELDKKSSKSRSLSKLTDKHMNPNSFQKMTVSLATQVFSNSVAAAIRTAKGTGELKSESAMTTASFIEKVNNMFDGLNSRNKFDDNPYKNALSKDAKYVKEAINEALDVFANLKKIFFKKEKDGTFTPILTRPPCFDGVLISCNAILQLFNEESSQPFIKFIITRRLNQDIVENLFARYRQKGGANRNPTSRTLRAVFRSNLVNSLIKLPTSSNCEDDNDEFLDLQDIKQLSQELILTPADEYTQPPAQEETTTKAQEEAEIPEPDKTPTQEKPQTSPSTSRVCTLEQCSVAYFAGYLVKLCLSKYNCAICTKKLLKDIDLNDETQLLILNKSYRVNKTIKLKLPSNKLLKFLNLAIDCFNINFNNIMHLTSLKSQLSKAIVDFLKCEAPELLKISCKEHLLFIIEKMILVKINFYCKNSSKSITGDTKHSKLRILKNK